MIKELELRIKKLLKKRWEESESQEVVAQPLMDKLPVRCVNCSLCDWIAHDGELIEICSEKCKQN